MKTTNSKRFCDISFFIALIFKMFSSGLIYYPVLDDYIQYGGYPLYDKLSYVYLNIGTIATRPFASLADPAVWGKTFPDLWIAALIIAVCFFFAAKLLDAVFTRLGISVTPFLYAILLLIPVGFEGTYWISASSRICVGLFFLSLTAYLLIKTIDTKKGIYIIPYVVLCILSFGFYETIMIMSFLLQFIIIVTLSKSTKERITFLSVPVLCGILMAGYYILAKDIGVMGNRTGGFTFDNLWQKTVEFFSQLTEIFTVVSTKITFLGAFDGFMLIISQKLFLTLALLILISALCAYFGGKLQFFAPCKKSIAMGAVLFIVPLLINIFVQDVWLTLRSVVPCFIGLVLISSPVFNKVFKSRIVRSVTIFILVLLFSLGNICELDTYRRVNETDNLLLDKICNQLDDNVLAGNKETVVVLDSEVISPQVCYYKDHVKSVFDSDWALTGAVRAKLGNIKIKTLTPVCDENDANINGKQVIYIGGNYE